MNKEFFILLAIFLLTDFLIFVTIYNIFIKFRYNFFFKIDPNNMRNINDSRFIAGGQPIDIIIPIVLGVILMCSESLIQRYILFCDQESYLYFQYIPMGHITSWFSLCFTGYIIRTYETYKDNYPQFLYWENFAYNGTRKKLFYDDPKYKTPYPVKINKSDIITQAENEKKVVKIFIVICALLCLISQYGVLLRINCFDKDSIRISYSEYEYSDIIGIYRANEFDPIIGSVIYEDYIVIVFNDGRKWDDRNKESLTEDVLYNIIQKSGVKPITCKAPPDDL